MAVKTGKMPAGLKRYRNAKNAKKTKKRGTVMAKRNTRARGKKKTTIPVAMLVGFAPLISRGINLWQVGGLQGLQHLVSSLIPYDSVNRKFTMAGLPTGLYPIVGGLLIHKFIGGSMGVNRALSGAGVPWIRL